MLSALSISNIVLIDQLDLDLHTGLCVLTGETGAGKSILLDALGLALGRRGGAGLVRKGCDRGTVMAAFNPPLQHPAWEILRSQDLIQDVTDGDELILRRQVGADGRGRAFVNDQAISTALLRRLGETLVEVHGQHDERGLLNPGGHRALLDVYGSLEGQVSGCAKAHARMRQTSQALADAQAALHTAQEEEDYLRHVCGELDELDPKPGDEEELDRTRTLLRQGEKISEALRDAQGALHGGGEGNAGGNGVEQRLRIAQRALQRVAESAGGALDGAIDGLERAAVEAMEGIEAVADAARSLDLDPARLETVEERLFALREAARKHRVSVDGLAALRDDFAQRLDTIDNGGQRLAALETEAAAAKTAYLEAAERLSKGRAKAAKKLDRAMANELPPLALDKAIFETVISRRDTDGWSAEGWDSVAFYIATNPGSVPGPLNKVASGGELSRVMLALKVALAQNREPASLIFDEVDSGVASVWRVWPTTPRSSWSPIRRKWLPGPRIIGASSSGRRAAMPGPRWRIWIRRSGARRSPACWPAPPSRTRPAADSLLQAAGS